MSTGPQGLIFTLAEATAGQRTFSVYLTDAAGDAKEDAAALAIVLSKAGAAFAAAAGSITQKVAKGGWYDVVLAAADLSALGDLAYEITGTDVAKLTGNLQVNALDLNTATVNPGAAGITSASFAAGAIDANAVATDALGAAELSAAAVLEVQSGLATAAAVESITLATRTVRKDLGTVDDSNGATAHTNSDDEYVGTSTLDSIDVTFQVSGTWDSATATVQTTQDPTADPVVWTDYVDEATDNPLTDDGEIIVAGGGHVAARVNFTSIGAATELAVTAVIRKPANT